MRVIEYEENGYIWAMASEQFNTPQHAEAVRKTYTKEENNLLERICRNLPTGREYMQIHYREYGWTEEMLSKAREFKPEPLLSPVAYFDPPWFCYENSFRHAQQTGLLYVEGIGICPSGPMVHAWNSTNGSDVLDYTWPQQELNRYFGIVYDLAWIKEHWPTPGGMLGYLHKYTLEGREFKWRLI